MACSTKVLCPQYLFSNEKNRKDTKVVYPAMWTNDIRAFDTSMYYNYYWQNHNILQCCKQNKHFHRIAGNKYSTLHVIKK